MKETSQWGVLLRWRHTRNLVTFSLESPVTFERNARSRSAGIGGHHAPEYPYCLQQWYGLADDALEDALYDSQAMRDFVGIDLSRESVPDDTNAAQVQAAAVGQRLDQGAV